jgi:hypothetical protein
MGKETAMKKILYLLILLAINAVLYAAPIRAEDDGANDFGLKEQKGYKDECLLIAVNCSNDFVSIEKKVEKLQKEILKGRAVYTDDELRILKEQLNDANRILNYFKYEGARNLY